jgi:hypothetical protein
MSLHLADNVQVRKESWGLLFYQPSRHKVCFVRSGDWLRPAHFDGTWTSTGIIDDISRRTGAPPEIIELSLPRLTNHLIKNRVIADEIR